MHTKFALGFSCCCFRQQLQTVRAALRRYWCLNTIKSKINIIILIVIIIFSPEAQTELFIERLIKWVDQAVCVDTCAWQYVNLPPVVFWTVALNESKYSISARLKEEEMMLWQKQTGRGRADYACFSVCPSLWVPVKEKKDRQLFSVAEPPLFFFFLLHASYI